MLATKSLPKWKGTRKPSYCSYSATVLSSPFFSYNFEKWEWKNRPSCTNNNENKTRMLIWKTLHDKLHQHSH